MPLNVQPPAPQPENNNTPTNPQGGRLPVKPPTVQPQERLTSRDLDVELQEKMGDLVKDEDFVYREELLNRNEYQEVGKLTSEQVLVQDYDTHYKRLEEKILSVKTWLQETLTEAGKSEDVAAARKNRNSKEYKEIKQYLDQLLVRHFAQEQVANKNDSVIISAMVTNEILGLGPIEPLWQDKRITEIMVNGPYRVRVEIGGKLIDVKGVKFRDATHLLDTCQQILAPLNKTIDIAHPLEDGRLPDGSRINITHPSVGPGGPFLTIRRFPETVFSMKKLVEMGSMTPEIAEEIGNLINAGCSTIISGGTGSGKTSMLNALSGCIPDDERIITIEDNLELRLHPKRDVVALEARRSHQGEKGSVTIRDLVRNSLRMRPDRIVVGEVRDGSAYDMLQAMNTGHEGSMTTVHANDAYGAIDRLVNLISQVGELDARQALSLLSNGVDLIVSIRRYEDGSRRVESIAELPSRVNIDERGNSSLEPIILWEFRQTGLTADDKVVGEYVRINEISDALKKKHRLDKKRRFSLAELYELSEQTS